MFRKEIGFNFPHWLPRKISRANLSCQLPVCLSLKRDEWNLLWDELFYCCFSDFFSSPKVLTPDFVVSVTFLKKGLVIKRRLTGFKGRTTDVFPLPATGDGKYKFLFLNTSCFELLLQHCHLIWFLCPGASLLPHGELWTSNFPQAFVWGFGELCFFLCHKSLLIPKK